MTKIAPFVRQSAIKVLIDTNVALTYVSGREDVYSKEIEMIMRLCAEERLLGFLAFHSLSTIWYVTRKLSDEKRREWLRQICNLLTVVGASQNSVIDAIAKYNFSDFEDCLQDKCALEAGCDYIVTANWKDFEHSEVRAINPDALLKLCV